MPNINIKVKDKIAVADETIYICGNSDFTINFTFDSEWDAFGSKTARFKHGSSYTDIVFSGNQCQVPVIENVYNIEVGVFAGNLHTTTPAYVFAKKSILCGSGSPVDPSSSVYDQIMTALNQKQPMLTAGSNITIDANNKISATDTVYDDTEVRSLISGKANQNHTHTKNQITDMDLSVYRTSADQDAIDSTKVDKVAGKQLSTNDYDNAAKSKIDAIPADPKYTDTVYDDSVVVGRIAAIEGKESGWDAKVDTDDIPGLIEPLTYGRDEMDSALSGKQDVLTDSDKQEIANINMVIYDYDDVTGLSAIKDDLDAGKEVVIAYTDSGTTYYFSLVRYYNTDGWQDCEFIVHTSSDGHDMSRHIYLGSDGNKSMWSTPVVTNSVVSSITDETSTNSIPTVGAVKNYNQSTSNTVIYDYDNITKFSDISSDVNAGKNVIINYSVDEYTTLPLLLQKKDVDICEFTAIDVLNGNIHTLYFDRHDDDSGTHRRANMVTGTVVAAIYDYTPGNSLPNVTAIKSYIESLNGDGGSY